MPITEKDNIKVNIREAHNIYFVCNDATMNNPFENVRKQKERTADMASTSVQTDPQHNRSSRRTPEDDVDTSSEDNRSATLGAETEGETSQNKPSGKERPFDCTNLMTEQMQYLNLSEDRSAEINQRCSQDNSAQRGEDAVAEGNQQTHSLSEMFVAIVEKKLPKGSKGLIKVFITHSEVDTEFAKEVVSRLRQNDRFLVSANYEVEPLMTVSNADFRMEAISWADILVPLITDNWLMEIDNVSLSNRSTSSLNTRYTFQLMHSEYLAAACTNVKVISAVKKGTNGSYRRRPEISGAITLMDDYDRFETIITDFHRMINARKRNMKGPLGKF